MREEGILRVREASLRCDGALDAPLTSVGRDSHRSDRRGCWRPPSRSGSASTKRSKASWSMRTRREPAPGSGGSNLVRTAGWSSLRRSCGGSNRACNACDSAVSLPTTQQCFVSELRRPPSRTRTRNEILAKNYSPEELSSRTFAISMMGVGLYIAAVLLFVI